MEEEPQKEMEKSLNLKKWHSDSDGRVHACCCLHYIQLATDFQWMLVYSE